MVHKKSYGDDIYPDEADKLTGVDSCAWFTDAHNRIADQQMHCFSDFAMRQWSGKLVNSIFNPLDKTRGLGQCCLQ